MSCFIPQWLRRTGQGLRCWQAGPCGAWCCGWQWWWCCWASHPCGLNRTRPLPPERHHLVRQEKTNNATRKTNSFKMVWGGAFWRQQTALAYRIHHNNIVFFLGRWEYLIIFIISALFESFKKMHVCECFSLALPLPLCNFIGVIQMLKSMPRGEKTPWKCRRWFFLETFSGV
jgi:hypothetical protein